MNTWMILHNLWSHWRQAIHPVYRADANRTTLPPAARQVLLRIVGKTWRPIGLASFAAIMIFVADFLCRAGRRPSSSLLLIVVSVCSYGGGAFIFMSLFFLTYLWPLSVAVAASGAIAEERERQTWDVLLTTPFAWSDLLLAKLSAALRNFHRYDVLLMWVHGFLVTVLMVIVLAEFSRAPGGTTIPQYVVTAAAMLEFAVARFQEYVLAALLGLLASLLTPTRQGAGSLAFLMAFVLVLIRAFLSGLVLFVANASGATVPADVGSLILLLTGPSSVIALAWTPLVGVLLMLGMVMIREAAIRLLWRWLVQNLGYSRELVTSPG